MQIKIDRTDIEPAWLSNLWLGIQAGGDYLDELLIAVGSVNRWLDDHMVKGNRENRRVVAGAIRAFSRGYDWRLIDLAASDGAAFADLVKTARRLWNVHVAARQVVCR